jgi:hypothetical protein
MSLEMAHKVILPPKKNYIPQFLKQRDINSYYIGIVECRIFCKQKTSSFTFYPFKPGGENAALQHFPDHHEGHLSLLRASLVNNRSVLSIYT